MSHKTYIYIIFIVNRALKAPMKKKTVDIILIKKLPMNINLLG